MSTSVPPPNMPQPEPAPFELPAPPRRIPGRVKTLSGVAALVAVVVLALVAFGGGSGGGPLGPVAQAATVSTGAAGYTVRLRMSMDIGSRGTPVTATGGGTFDSRDRSGSMSVTMNTASIPQLATAMGGGNLTIREILKGTTVYMQFPAAMMRGLPFGGKQWLSIDLAKLPGMSGIGSLMGNPASSNPAQMLEYLRAVSGSVSEVGHNQVDGFATTHYSASIDVSRLADALPAADRAAAQQLLSTMQQSAHVDQIPVDVWVDAQHLVRRMQMSLAPSGSGAGVAMTIDFPYYGPEPSPSAPPAGQVADLSSALSGLGAGSLGGATFGTPSVGG